MKPIALLLLTLAAVAQASVTVSRTSGDGPHPSTMEIEVQLPDSTMVLIPLIRTDTFEDVPMTLVENGVSRTFSSRQAHHPSHSHYRDIDSRSVISVRHENGKRKISGHVMHEGTSYFLEPVGDSKHRVTKNKMNPDAMARQIDLSRSNSDTMVKQIGMGWINMPRRLKRQTNLAVTTYTVELYLLLDSTVWNAFLTVYSAEATALSELHLYYTHILNGIDTAYRNIQPISISVSCIGMTISKTAADDAWMPGSLDGSDILAAMRTYIVGRVADHFMAFTRLDISSDRSGASLAGKAYLGGVCSEYRASINEDKGLHTWGVAAHELGHNLGSEHDSDGNTCGTEFKNIMAPSTAFFSREDVANSYRFSACSVGYIANFVTSLGSSSCLVTAQGRRLPELESSDREGARMTLDQVCRLTYPNGPGKFYLSSSMTADPASICAKLYCLMADGTGVAASGLRAPVGTPCGNRRSCNWNGECAADSSAPAVDETCFWGDSWPASSCQSWKVAIEKNGKVCRSDVKKSCCKTVGLLPQCAGI